MKKIISISSFLLFTFCLPHLTLAQTISLADDAFIQFQGTPGDYAAVVNASAGDVNNDGFDDILMGASYNDDGGTNAGAVYLIYGEADTLSNTTLSSSSATQFTGEAASDLAGEAIASAGDVNNDGYDDMLIGARGNDEGGSESGAAYLIYGQSEPLTDISLGADTDTIVQFTGEAGIGGLGGSLSPAGDVNGDGFDDIFIGAVGHDADYRGYIYLIYGQSSPLSDVTLSVDNTVKFTGERVQDQAGNSLSSVGDMNNDGYDEFVISGIDLLNDGVGAMYLIYGQSSPLSDRILSAATTVKLTPELDDIFASGDSAGDVNNDGYDDFVIGGYFPVGDTNKGVAYLLYGQSATFDDMVINTSNATQFIGEGEGEYFDTDSAGDVNNDTFEDIIISSYLSQNDTGAVYVIYGQSSVLSDRTLSGNNTVKFTGEAEGDQAGVIIGSGGDVNNDGYDEILIGGFDSDTGGSTGQSGIAYLGYLYEDVDEDAIPGGLLGTDCDDNNESVSEDQIYYDDDDGDGLGSDESISECVTTAPAGYVSNDDDCDDSDSAVSEDQTYYTDSDGDGLGSNSSITECVSSAPDGYADNSDDTNDTIKNDGVEIDGDSVDNDDDGSVDEVNTLAENGVHPEYGTYDPNSQDAYTAAVSKIEGFKNGKIKVRYADNSVYRYPVYDVDTDSKTKVKSFNSKGYLIVLQPKGKKVALMNGFTGEKLSTKKLSDDKWKYIGLKIAKVQGKNVVLATTKKKDGTVKLSLVKVKLAEETFKKLSQKTTVNGAVNETKTKGTDTTVQLRNGDSKTLKTYNVTEDFDLFE